MINVLFPGLNVPETNRTDIVQALLTGIPGVTQIGKNPAAALPVTLLRPLTCSAGGRCSPTRRRRRWPPSARRRTSRYG